MAGAEDSRSPDPAFPDLASATPPTGETPTRRSFLKIASTVSASIASLLVGVPTLRAFISPGLKAPEKKGWIKVGQADAIDIETPVKVDFVEAVNDGWIETRALRSVWVYTDDGEKFTAFSGTCTHLGCSFGLDKENNTFMCPCHHGVFDIKTGAVLSGPPPRALDPLPVRVVDGNVQVIYTQFRSGIAERVEV